MVHYSRPQYRLPEYLVSVIAGYLMYDMKCHEIKLTHKQVLTSWACWILSLGFIYCHVYDVLRPNFDVFFYDAIARCLWSLAICWIIFACQFHKTGGIIRWFLSLNMWQPFSKIGLSIYLIHSLYLRPTRDRLQEKSSFGCWWNFQIHITDIFFASLLGLMIYLVVEAPSVKILETLWTKKNKTEEYVVCIGLEQAVVMVTPSPDSAKKTNSKCSGSECSSSELLI